MEYQTPNVYIEEVSGSSKPIQGVSSGISAFIGIATKGPVGRAVMVGNFNEFKEIFGGHTVDSYLAYAVENFFIEAGAGARAFIVRTAHYEDISEVSSLTANPASATFKDSDLEDALIVSATSPGLFGNNYKVQIKEATDAASVGEFDVLIFYGSSDNPIKTIKNTNVKKIDGFVFQDLKFLSVSGKHPTVTVKTTLDGGNDGIDGMTDIDYIGSQASETGLYALDVVDENLNIVIPGITTRSVQISASAYAANKGYFITDVPMGLTFLEAKEYKSATGKFAGEAALASDNLGIYYPWYEAKDPLTGNKKLVPTSAAMAGVFARTAATRGVHKAPAGVEDGKIRTAVGIERIITDTQQAELNPVGVNVIRAFPDAGIVCWGARTTSADPEWRYVNVRLLFNYIASSLQKGTKWAVFEPNDQILWSKITLSVKAFLNRLYKQGAFFDGGTGRPEDAYYVICDETVNTQSVVDAGQVVIEIGIAPSKPGEFIRFRLSQWDGGRLLEELS